MTGHELIAKAEHALEELEGHGMLDAYAAQAAAIVLVDNWRAAVSDGIEPSKLLPDVDRAIAELRFFQSLLS